MARASKRTAQGNGSIRKRSDGTYEGRFTIGRDPGTGKQIQKSIYAKTQKEVSRKLKQITAQIDEGTYSEPSKLPFSTWLDIWAREYTSNLKPRTLILYQSHIDHHIKPALGALKLSEIKPHQVQSFYNHLSKGTNIKQPLSAKTVKNIHGVLHSVLEQAVKNGYIRDNPSGMCTLPRTEKHEIQPLNEKQMVDFLNAIRGHRFEVLLKVDLFTGMRQGELLGLTWECVDFAHNVIHVKKQLQLFKGTYHMTSLKNDKARIIVPAPSIMALLREHKREQTKWRIRMGDDWIQSDYVFTDESGKHLSHRTVYNNFKRIVESIGLSSARFHDLRHSYATAAIRAGDDIKTVQENLGHHTPAFTLEVYGHVTEEMRRESADRMEQFINMIPSK